MRKLIDKMQLKSGAVAQHYQNTNNNLNPGGANGRYY